MTIIDNTQTVGKVLNQQKILVKPSIQELIEAFIEYHQVLKEREHDSAWWFDSNDKIKNSMAWGRLSNDNWKYLSVSEYEDYDLFNFDRVIASIELNGKKHFNMAGFLGILDQEAIHQELDEENLSEGIYSVNTDFISQSKGEGLFDTTTKAFNCDTVGCIAGFCAANAVDWNDMLWNKASNFNINHHDLYETVACNFLNIPMQVGKKLFYGDSDSIWAYLAHSFSNQEDFKTLEFEDEYDDSSGIDLNSINANAAIAALKMIRNGDISFSPKNNYNMKLSEKYEG